MITKTKTFITEGIVIKRTNTGEADRVITFVSRDFGKLVGIAKGIRNLKSSRRADLEPGNLVKIFGVKTKSMPLITQTMLIENVHQDIRTSLSGIRSLSQILEVFDRLFAEDDQDEEAYLLALKIREALVLNRAHQKIQPLLSELIERMGYQSFEDVPHQSILDYVAEITEKEMKSFEYLRIK
ncbi:MAG: DNA repair protein RecO [Candidatus Pacebacteria bacterium]|nr:DNA repair protein RecO [Candidatus Paceibacterota bacterium]